MIGWMQHNKKYLVVTLWISAFAFIGAGFVGWGSYSYGSKATSIAKVGDVEIKLSELQQTYSNLYGYYSQMFGGQFDEEQARNMGLQETAFNMLKREALLLNVAKDFGLIVLDKEIAEHILNTKDFQQDGNFSREQYEFVLKNSGMTPKEYEGRISKVILITKLQKLLKIDVTPLEKEIFNSLTKLEDKLEYKVLSFYDVEVSVTDDEVISAWELTKEKYKTDEKYKISYIETPLIEKDINDSEIEEYYNTHALDYNGLFEDVKEEIREDILKDATKNSALKEYLAFKKGEYSDEVFSDEIGSINLLLSLEEMEKLKGSEVGSYLKPVFSGNRFVSIKLEEIVSPQLEKFEDVKDIVEAELEFQKKEDKLMEIAKSDYKTFQGTESGFIKISDIDKIDGLSPEDANTFLGDVFTQPVNNGFVKVNSNVVLYRVLEQRVGENKIDIETSTILNIKEQLLDENLIKKLEFYYPVETYFKG